MSRKVLQFKSCVNEYTGIGTQMTSYNYIGIGSNDTNTNNAVVATYASDSLLAGKVEGFGYGWQKFIIPTSGKCKFIVRGAAGGLVGANGAKIDPVTGALSGNIKKPGRGAKLVGEAKLKKGDILYLLVGMRGWCNTYQDWGGGGGGASVVLLDNPSGAYTLTPLNRKVDVLFVAGGGGGSPDNACANVNSDAIYTNGTNTNGGTSRSAIGGAGLTGNSSNGSQGYARSILSGGVPTTSMASTRYGGWGGRRSSL